MVTANTKIFMYTLISLYVVAIDIRDGLIMVFDGNAMQTITCNLITQLELLKYKHTYGRTQTKSNLKY